MIKLEIEVTVSKVNNFWRARYKNFQCDNTDPYRAIKGLCRDVHKSLQLWVEPTKIVWKDPEPKQLGSKRDWRDQPWAKALKE